MSSGKKRRTTGRGRRSSAVVPTSEAEVGAEAGVGLGEGFEDFVPDVVSHVVPAELITLHEVVPEPGDEDYGGYYSLLSPPYVV